MNSNGAQWRRKVCSKNVVKRGKGVIFAQVIEKANKINFKKCPIYPMQYDIMVL
jgi:hypothetical protein